MWREIMDKIRDELRLYLYDVVNSRWMADYVRLRFSARKTSSDY